MRPARASKRTCPRWRRLARCPAPASSCLRRRRPCRRRPSGAGPRRRRAPAVVDVLPTKAHPAKAARPTLVDAPRARKGGGDGVLSSPPEGPASAKSPPPVLQEVLVLPAPQGCSCASGPWSPASRRATDRPPGSVAELPRCGPGLRLDAAAIERVAWEKASDFGVERARISASLVHVAASFEHRAKRIAQGFSGKRWRDIM